MKERPILFNGPMVRAILEGRKTQTRRVVKYNPILGEPAAWCAAAAAREPGWMRIVGDYSRFCPYGQPGDSQTCGTRLWVRETWALLTKGDGKGDGWTNSGVAYRADVPSGERVRVDAPWRPSIHMPRWASRLTLEVLSVRVERLQDISEADARAEGIERVTHVGPLRAFGWKDYSGGRGFFHAADSFRSLWEAINGSGSWDANPWVWVMAFRRLEGAPCR